MISFDKMITVTWRVCINLKHRIDRREQAWKQFAHHDLKVEHVAAIDAKHARNAHGYARPGLYALALTDRLILREAKRKDAPAVLIFEDDVVLHPEFHERMKLLELPEDWGLLYLGCTHYHRPEIVGPGLVKLGWALDTHAVLVNARYYDVVRRLLAGRRNFEKVHFAAPDVLLASIQEQIPSYAAFPNLAWQAEGYSDIEATMRGNYFPTGEQRLSPEIVAGLEADMRQRYPHYAEICRATLPAREASIPKVIHQTWKTREIEAPFRQAWVDSWQELNPDWDYRLWTDEDLEEFIRTEFPSFLATYLSYDVAIKKVDAARYLILKRLGGVFVDLDFICLRPLEALLEKEFILFGQQFDNPRAPGAICNAFMASAPDHPFWDGIEAALTATRNYPILEAAGPDFLTQRFIASQMFLEPGMMPTILPPFYLYPLVWDDARKYDLRQQSRQEMADQFPAAFAITLWTGTWMGEMP